MSKIDELVRCRECRAANGNHKMDCTRRGEQPIPTKNDRPHIQDLVIQDIEARRQLGVRRYGTALQPHNGRNALRDAYEESLDLACYLRQALYEQENGSVTAPE